MASLQLKGTGVALITPFHANGSIDYPSLEKLVDKLLRETVDFLVVLGTTGEAATLTAAEKQELLNAVAGFAKGSLPIVCGIGGNNTEEVVQQLKTMDLRAADAILSVAPYYSRPSQEGLYQHFVTVARATNKPVILYNVPARTGCNLLPVTVARIAATCKNIFGIKEASGDLAQCTELMRLKPDHFTVLSGDDNLVISQMAIGMEGVISVAANCFTKEVTDIINLSMVNKYEKARKALFKVLPGFNLLFAEGNPAGIKAALNQTGYCENVLRLPLVPVSDALYEQIGHFLANYQG